MGICKKCGRKGLFLLIGRDGLCGNCRKTYRETETTIRKIDRQIEQLDKERDSVLSAPDLTPQEVDGHIRSYHYKDVNVWVNWQYGGVYGKSCASIGMRRGDLVELVPHRRKDDPEQVSVRWNGVEIANMKTGRMRGMVQQWYAAKLPVRCVVSAVGGEQKLLLEFAFYGRPKFENKQKSAQSTINSDLLERIEKCNGHFVSFDVETTGFDRDNDRIVEISAVRFINWIPTDTFTTLICAEREISAAAFSVNGIKREALIGAPNEKESMNAFACFIGHDAIEGNLLMVAHNAPFDKSFVENALQRNGIFAELQCADTLQMSRSVLPDLGKYTLSVVAGFLHIEQQQAHRAANDALVCGEIFVKLAQTLLDRKAVSRRQKKDLSPLEKELCDWICNTLQNAGCETEHLSFNVSTYLSVNCWHLVFRLKPRAKKPYILIPIDLPLPPEFETASATKSEGENLKRMFFTSTQDLSVLSDWIIEQYASISVQTSHYWRMGNPYRREIQSIQEGQYRPHMCEK